jgi:hypothetical protein
MKSGLAFVGSILVSGTQRRHLFRWIESQRSGYLLNKPSPWLTFDAIEFLKDLVPTALAVFEYGSGGSTLFWLAVGSVCISVEHDPDWYEVVSQRIRSNKAADYRLVLPEVKNHGSPQSDYSDPDAYASADERFHNCSFQRYVSQIDQFPDQHFDIILIDGRARPSCIKHSVSKVKIGGMLVVDNSERDYYFTKTRAYLEPFQVKEFPGAGPLGKHFWKTSIFIRSS